MATKQSTIDFLLDQLNALRQVRACVVINVSRGLRAPKAAPRQHGTTARRR